ncbi:DUF285 domain-containing protein [Prevotella sp. OH937_COT-195]|uniref:DUF285 domain-containing protein n=1 Tax=Prevotella sp. OH937_COT-195 TaxID=2491051 RepID=UPI001F2F7DBF|nr:DUF285 domain-containing protein [Prevotella sp. OH937_COT-195]
MNKKSLLTLVIATMATMMSALPQSAQAQKKEAYVMKSKYGTTLTFYYDTQKGSRQGTVYGINETQIDKYGKLYPVWSGIFNTNYIPVNKAVFDSSFKDYRPKTTKRWFSYLNSLKQIIGMKEHLNTSEVTDMSEMFYACIAITSIDVTGFDTKNVTDMGDMFAYCRHTNSLDVSGFKTGNVTNMRKMFCGCKSLTSLNLSSFNTENVTSMRNMFANCKSLTSLDLLKFKTAKVTDMTDMFFFCTSLTTIYCNDDWKRDGIKSEGMFNNCTKLKGAVPYDNNNTDMSMANPDNGYFTKVSTGISSPGTNATIKVVYSADGIRQKQMHHGLNIVKMSDGTMRKIFRK